MYYNVDVYLRSWNKEELNNLYWYYTRCATSNDPIGKMMELYGGIASAGKTRESVQYNEPKSILTNPLEINHLYFPIISFIKILNQLLHQRIIGYNQFLKFLALEKMETGDSTGVDTCDIRSTNTSSSHATAGSSCHSVPTSVLMDHLRDANQSSFSFRTPDCFPLSSANSVDAESEFVKLTDGLKEKDEEPEVQDPEVDIVSASLSANTISHSDTEYDDDLPPINLPDSVPMDISDLDIALGELINQILGEGQDLLWLQKQVLQACHVKFNFETKKYHIKAKGNLRETFAPTDAEESTEESHVEIVGPIPYHYTRKPS